tara:strand:+ start:308 stop:1423 length:1116 start_codon:yes stop_codon:yes gene_type:complete
MKINKFLQLLFKKLIQKIFRLFYGKILILNESKILYKKHYVEFIKLDNNKKLSVKKNVHQISNARVYTDTVEHVAIIKDNLIIPKISYQQIHGELKGAEFNKVLISGTPRIIKKFDGRVLSLVQGASAHNYFHFLFDILAKLILCEEKIPLRKIDYFYVHKKIEWQIKIFKLFNINANQLISSEKHHHIKSDEIIAIDPPWYEKSFVQNEIANLPEWIIIKLRERLIKFSKKFDFNDKIFIDRSDSINNHCKLVNNDEIIDHLSKKGFSSYQISKLDFLEQIYLFNNAKIIVGPHGAAFSNIIFSKPNTKIIEIIPSNHQSMKCQRISDILNLNYTRINKPKIITTSTQLTGDMEISIEELDNTLNKLEKI